MSPAAGRLIQEGRGGVESERGRTKVLRRALQGRIRAGQAGEAH